MLKIICSLAMLLLASPVWVTAAQPTNQLGLFSTGTLNGWEEKSFQGATQYSLIRDEQLQQTVLKAESVNGASGLFHEQRIDLTKTPWLHWSWKTTSLFKNINENIKSGDDFVARIYVVVDGGYFFWKTIALNYVWSSTHQKSEQWDNPYTSNATMYAVEAGEDNMHHWQSYKRNIRQDFKQLIGEDIRYIDAIAIMTDTDNSHLQTITYFGDIFFTSE